VSGHGNIANMWCNHYKQLLNSNSNTKSKSYVTRQFNLCASTDFSISSLDVKEAVKDLKKGKSPGLDNISSEHFKYASDKLYVLLSLVLNCMIKHGYLPAKFMETVLVPIVKDKKGDITDGDNYRPIAITCVTSKVVELVILEKFLDYLHTTDNQFGFKHGLSTEFCIFTLKQTIEYYRSLSSPVYICYLDASKAFDRINHWCLFRKLLDRNVPILAVRFLCAWYSSQLFTVQWGLSVSEPFSVSNGVSQGGIISPFLFNVYIDDLSVGLSNLKTGCNFNGVFVNHVVYADDTVLLAPAPSALQKLIDYCGAFAEDNDIFYNLKKTKCMCIRPKGLTALYFPKVYLNGEVVKVVNKEKYLGAFIVDDLSDDDDIMRQMRSIYAHGNILIRNFKNCSNEVKTALFRTFCTGFYCSSLWGRYLAKSFRKAKVAYNNVFRLLFGTDRRDSVSKAMLDFNIDPFDVVIRKYIVSFSKRLHNCDNSIVSALYNWTDYQCSSLYKVWLKKAHCI